MNEDEEKRYAATLGLLHQAEATTWARFRAYLILAGFLATGLAWAAAKGQGLVIVLLASAGAGLSWVFYTLIFRSRAFVTLYENRARAMERGLGPLTDGEKLSDELKKNHALGAREIVPAVPMCCGWLFAALALAPVALGIFDSIRGRDHWGDLRRCVDSLTSIRSTASAAPASSPASSTGNR